MAPGFDTLSDHDFEDEEDVDFSDLRQQYDVRMEQGLDAFVVSGLPLIFCVTTYKPTRSSTVYQLSLRIRSRN